MNWRAIEGIAISIIMKNNDLTKYNPYIHGIIYDPDRINRICPVKKKTVHNLKS
jgi:hypothetical protein